jgi:hypothetical protein
MIADYPEIKKRNGELLSKVAILSEIKEKLTSINENLSSLKGQLFEQYDKQKSAYLARGDVLSRIKRIAEMMNTNFPTLMFEPIEASAIADIPLIVTEPVVTSTVMKKKNRRVSMFDCEPSLIEMFDVSGYTFNPPSDNDLSFSPSNRPLRRESNMRYSALFDRNFGF